MLKKWFIGLCLVTAMCLNSLAEVEWVKDFETAVQRAKAERKPILLDFTGSDWCGWCMKLKSEVFDQAEFAAYAKENLIMLEVDFPHHKELSARQTAANEQLSADYKITGFPTVILIDATGKQIGKSGYVPGGPKSFIASLESNPGYASRGAPLPSAAPQADAAPAPHPAPEFVPIPPVVPNKYGDMALKGLSGVKDHRLALINNVTLMAGETGKVKVHDQRVDVTVKEIRNDSVLIVIDGTTRELKLAER